MRGILVTGASGLIGSALVSHICGDYSSLGGRLDVFAATRYPELHIDECRGNVHWVRYDATKPLRFDFEVDTIVHGASFASPELFVKKPVETIMANIYGLREILEYGIKVGVKKVVYVSSSEVYGRMQPRDTGFIESDCGFVDAFDVRSSYAIGKRAAEALAVAYSKEYGMDISIVRPGHIYGPTASSSDMRVSSAFAWKAAKGEPIVLKSAGRSRRSYTHCEDCARAIMTVVRNGLPAEAYNIANRDGVCSIRQMAEIMAHAGGVELITQVPDVTESAAFNPMENSCLDPSKLESLGWKGLIGYEEGFRRTIDALRSKISVVNKGGTQNGKNP